MTRFDPPDFERDLATALEEMASPADHALLERVSTEVAATPQRGGRVAWRDTGWTRWVAVVGVAVVAMVVGILIGSSRLMVATGDDPTPTPSASRTPSTPATWGSWTEPSSYRYGFSSRCGERSLLGFYVVTVADGAVVDFRPRSPESKNSTVTIEDIPTLGELVGRAAEAQSAAEARVTVETDSLDGHPTSIEIDWNPMAVDDEECYWIASYGNLSTFPSITWAEPPSYEFTAETACGFGQRGTVKVTVEDGRPIDYRTLSDTGWRPLPLEDAGTLGDLVRKVEEAIGEEETIITALEVDPSDGHLTRVDFDPLPGAIDDEYCVIVKRYRITDPSSTEGPVPTNPPGSANWEEPSGYRFVVSDTRCGGGERNYFGTWKLTVRDGDVTASRLIDETASARPVPTDALPTLRWIEEKASEAELEASAVVEVQRDPADGHIVLLRIDWLPNAIDDEECYRILSYTPDV